MKSPDSLANAPRVENRRTGETAAGQARVSVKALRWHRDVPVDVARIAVLVVFVLIWELAARLRWIDPFFISKPTAVWDFLVDVSASGVLWRHISVTLQETLWGFVLGAGSGVGAGLILGRFPRLDAVFDPYVSVLNALPRVALAPLFMLWFGLGMTSKVVLAVSLVFFILLINTRAGLKGVDSDLIIIARLLAATERQLFSKVILPASVPAIFAGLRLGGVYSLLGVVVGEMVAAEAGLGQQLTFYAGTFNIAGVFGVLLIVSIIAAALNAVTARIERHLLRWQEGV